MKSPEILQSIPAESVEEIFASIHSLDKASYRSLLNTMATRRKLRPVFLERKPRVERHLWMRDELVRANNQDLADQVLQVWLLSACRPMICAFLDKLEVAHDGQGLIEVIPDEPEAGRVRKAMSALLEEYQPRQVLIYLHFFAEMDDGKWRELRRLLETEESFKLKPHAVTV